MIKDVCIKYLLSGLQAHPFLGIPSIQQIVCSGEVLESETALLGMTLFSRHDNIILAYVNVRDNECSTSASYSACYIDYNDYRKTRLITLVTDFPEDRTSRAYGCNITGFRAGKAHLLSWSVDVMWISMYLKYILVVLLLLLRACILPREI